MIYLFYFYFFRHMCFKKYQKKQKKIWNFNFTHCLCFINNHFQQKIFWKLSNFCDDNKHKVCHENKISPLIWQVKNTTRTFSYFAFQKKIIQNKWIWRWNMCKIIIKKWNKIFFFFESCVKNNFEICQTYEEFWKEKYVYI